MKKDLKIFIEHILESIERIEEYIKEITRDEFLNSRKTQDAVSELCARAFACFTNVN